jgi:hypothetical protein
MTEAVPDPERVITLHLQKVPARNGLLWVRHGFKLFQRKPMALAGLFSATVLITAMVAMLPVIGALTMMALPLISLGFMQASHLVLQDKVPGIGVFVAPLRLTLKRRRSLLILCASYGLLFIGAAELCMLLAGDSIDALRQAIASGQTDPAQLEPLLSDPRLNSASLLLMLTLSLLSIPYWHAPALIHWGGQGVLQALFSSTLALWRNKAAFAVNALCWLALGMTASTLISLLSLLLGLGGFAPMLLIGSGMLLSTVFYTSLYFTFVDCFMFGAPRELLNDKP